MEWFVWRRSMELCLCLTRNLRDLYIERGVKKDHSHKETWVWLDSGQRNITSEFKYLQDIFIEGCQKEHRMISQLHYKTEMAGTFPLLWQLLFPLSGRRLTQKYLEKWWKGNCLGMVSPCPSLLLADSSSDLSFLFLKFQSRQAILRSSRLAVRYQTYRWIRVASPLVAGTCLL